MAEFETIRRQVAISGKVTDSTSGKPLADVMVEIVSGPSAFTSMMAVKESVYGPSFASSVKRPDKTKTRADGHFHFMDLPDGSYTLRASWKTMKNRYGTAQRVVSVSRTPSGNVILTASDIQLSPSTVRGRILRQGTTTPVVMAEVRVSGSLEFTHSDTNGDYALKGLESSASRPRSVTVSAVGYQNRNLDVIVPAPGDEVVLNVQLVPL